VNSGLLLAFDGLDGCGKTTQLARFALRLRAAGHDVLETHEPTEGVWGRRIRAMARSGERVPADEELRWFVEDRAEHVEREIAPALAAGRTVLTDRYTLSTVAYQGARGLDWRELLADAEARFPLPDLVLLFEIEPAAGMARIRARGEPLEPSFEETGFLTRVAQVFAALPCSYIERIAGAGSVDRVEARVRAALERRLPDLF